MIVELWKSVHSISCLLIFACFEKPFRSGFEFVLKKKISFSSAGINFKFHSLIDPHIFPSAPKFSLGINL